MSSGSKVQKTIKKVSAEQILEERDARNNRARANMMLREQKMAMAAADEYEEPGLALKLLEKDAEEAYCKACWGLMICQMLAMAATRR